MPFGLHGAAATFQRLVDCLLQPHREYAAAYIDDVIVFSKDWPTHLRHLRAVLGQVRAAGLTINPEKCKIGREEAQYLGFQVGKGQVKPVISKVEAIKRVAAPSTRKEVQRFLGMVGYYRSFIPRFSEKAAPLTDAIRGKGKSALVWTKGCEEAFRGLKEALCKAPVLRAPDFTQPFKVMTDASGRGLGAVLSQDFAGEEHPLMYLSRKLTPAEMNYSTIERETLAVKWALETLRYYLLGAQFELITDHAPLTWLNRMKDSNARLTRWYLALQPFRFKVSYKRGKTHCNADFLSRQEFPVASRPDGAAAPVLPGGGCDEGGYLLSEGLATQSDMRLKTPRPPQGEHFGPLEARSLSDFVRLWRGESVPRRGITVGVGNTSRSHPPIGIGPLPWKQRVGATGYKKEEEGGPRESGGQGN